MLVTRFRLKLPGFILCEGFTPTEQDGALDFDLGAGSIVGRLFDDVPEKERELEITMERQFAPGIALLKNPEGKEAMFRPILELRDSEPPIEVIAALTAGATNSHTNEYGLRLLEIILRIQDSLIHLLRFSYNQFWLVSDYRWEHEEGHLQGWFRLLKASWLHPEQGWTRLILGNPTLEISISIYPWDGIQKSEWLELGKRVAELAQRRHLPTWQLLVANSVEYLAKGNHRLAVVEAVTALEIMVKDGLRVALMSTIADDSGVRAVEKLVEKVGLRAATEMLLAMSPELAEAERILRAIEIRNEVIHGSRRKVPYEDARVCINAARNFMVRLANDKIGG